MEEFLITTGPEHAKIWFVDVSGFYQKRKHLTRFAAILMGCAKDVRLNAYAQASYSVQLHFSPDWTNSGVVEEFSISTTVVCPARANILSLVQANPLSSQAPLNSNWWTMQGEMACLH